MACLRRAPAGLHNGIRDPSYRRVALELRDELAWLQTALGDEPHAPAQDALQALTMWPAEAFHLDHRIGSLQKGKDGDMVVFSGNPFEPMSKVLLVVCNGRVVVDNREQAQ